MAAHDANDKSNSLKKPSNDLDLFDQIQDEFDALLSGDALPELGNVQADEQNALTDLVLQDTTEFLSTTDMRALDLSPDKSAEVLESPEETGPRDSPAVEPEAVEAVAEPAMTEVANEAVASEHGAIADETASTASTDTIEEDMPHVQEDDSLSRQSEAPEPLPFEEHVDATDAGNTNKIFLEESDLSDASAAEKPVDSPPVQDNHASDLDGIDPFSDDMDDVALKEKAPVHPDMSEDHDLQRRGGGRFVLLAGIVTLTVAGGIFWFVSGTPEQTKQLASSQEQSVSNTADKQPGLPDTSSVASVEAQQPQEKTQTEVTTQKKKDSANTVTAQPEETEKAATQRAAVEKAKAKVLAAKQAAEKRAAAEKAKAERLAAKQAAEKRAAAEKAKAERLAAEKAAAKKVAVIQPSTQLQKLPLKSQTSSAVVDEPGDWVIELASVNSAKSARQHMARIRAMGVESKTVQVNDKGRIFHSIRITGFTSKREAMKRRDALAKLLGVRGAKVEKL